MKRRMVQIKPRPHKLQSFCLRLHPR
jgi:hypothetical protein